MTLKNEKDDFTKIKWTILLFLIGKISIGLIFMTGSFCMRYLKIKSPKTAYNK